MNKLQNIQYYRGILIGREELEDILHNILMLMVDNKESVLTLYEKTPAFKANTFSDNFYKNINMERIKFVLDRGSFSEAILRSNGIYSCYIEDINYIKKRNPYTFDEEVDVIKNRKLEIRLDKVI